MIRFLKRWQKRRRKLRKLQDRYNWLSAKSLDVDYKLKCERLASNEATRELGEFIQKRKGEREYIR